MTRRLEFSLTELHTYIKCPKCDELVRASLHIPEECKKNQRRGKKSSEAFRY